MSNYMDEIETVQHFADTPVEQTADIRTLQGMAYISRAVGLMLDDGLIDVTFMREVDAGIRKLNEQRQTLEVIEAGEIDARSFVLGVLFALDNEAHAVFNKRIPPTQ